MKNLIFGFSLLFLLSSFSSSNEPPLVRAWWKTALVDAAGALGGAGSVASISAGLSTTNPVGWGCMAAGAVLGGAGASLAMVVPPGETLTLEAVQESFPYAANSSNSNDNVGSEHNDIITGFVRSQKTFSTKNYVDYIKSLDNKEYNDALKVIDSKYLEAEFKIVRRIKTETDALDLVQNRLPKGIDSEMLIRDLKNAMNAQTSRAFVTEIKDIELNYSKDKKINKRDKLILNSFFSTLRHSAALWNK